MSEDTCGEASMDVTSAPTDARNSTKFNFEQRKRNIDAEECKKIIIGYKKEIIKSRESNDTKYPCLNYIKHELIFRVLTSGICLMVLPKCFYIFPYRGAKLNYDEFCYFYYRKLKNKNIMATKQYYKALKIRRNQPFLETYERFIYCLILCLVSILSIAIFLTVTFYVFMRADKIIEIKRVSAILVTRNEDMSKTKYIPILSLIDSKNSIITLHQPDPELLADHHVLELRLSFTIRRFKRHGTINIVKPVLLRLPKNKGAVGINSERIYCFYLPSVYNFSFFNLKDEKQSIYCSDTEKHEISVQTTMNQFRISIYGTTYVFSLLAVFKIFDFCFSLSMSVTEYVQSLDQSINMELHERVPEIETVLIKRISELLKKSNPGPEKKTELAELFGALVTLNRCLTLKIKILEDLKLNESPNHDASEDEIAVSN